MPKTAAKAASHGAAIRTPAPHDARGWARLWLWLGDHGMRLEDAGAVGVWTPDGWVTARPGDWIILSVSGAYHVASPLRPGASPGWVN